MIGDLITRGRAKERERGGERESFSLYTCREEKPCDNTARGSHLQTRKRVLTRNQNTRQLDLGLPAFTAVEKYISVV